MKRLLLSILVILSLECIAQQTLPQEWVQYTSDEYIFDIQCDFNEQNLPEAELKKYLLDIVRANIAKQIQVQIQDYAKLNKESKNGQATIIYLSETKYSTDVELRLLETKTYYNRTTKECYAIAYINKFAASRYYQNEISNFLSKVDNSLSIAKDFIDTGFKYRAKIELETILSEFNIISKDFFWLDLLGVSLNKSAMLLSLWNEKEQAINRLLTELQYGISIYLSCTTNIFGDEYQLLQNELKGKLSVEGCNFTSTPENADWIIMINITARKHDLLNLKSHSIYFAYVDANIVIDKSVTSQRIYENGISIKRGDTGSYKNAAQAACKQLCEELGIIIIQNIKR